MDANPQSFIQTAKCTCGKVEYDIDKIVDKVAGSSEEDSMFLVSWKDSYISGKNIRNCTSLLNEFYHRLERENEQEVNEPQSAGLQPLQEEIKILQAKNNELSIQVSGLQDRVEQLLQEVNKKNELIVKSTGQMQQFYERLDSECLSSREIAKQLKIIECSQSAPRHKEVKTPRLDTTPPGQHGELPACSSSAVKMRNGNLEDMNSNGLPPRFPPGFTPRFPPGFPPRFPPGFPPRFPPGFPPRFPPGFTPRLPPGFHGQGQGDKDVQQKQ